MSFTEKELIQSGDRLAESVSGENKSESEVKREAVTQISHYAAALPEDMQEEIRQKITARLTELGIFTPENLENIMGSKVCDVEVSIDTRAYIQRMEEEQYKKAAEQGKCGRR